MNTTTILAHQSLATDARQAAQEFHAAVNQPGLALVLFFCSSEYALDDLAGELARLFGDTPMLGCTTAGEFGPLGYTQHSLSGASFAAPDFQAVAGPLGPLADFTLGAGQALAETLVQDLERLAPDARPDHRFALLLIDGLSAREELVAHALQYALGRVPLFGGSAGDSLRFEATQVYCAGRFHPNGAALALVSTPLPFRIFKTQHFLRTDERLVVTAADAARRTVMDINGLPASREYARIIGVAVDGLGPELFAAHPVVVVMNGIDYVRSIQKANPDGSLTFYCAIEEGVVLRVARGANLLDNLRETFAELRAELGPPRAVIAADCALRHLETLQNGDQPAVDELLRQHHALGFSSYGEQFHGVHVNQTFTGLFIGTDPDAASARPKTAQTLAWDDPSPCPAEAPDTPAEILRLNKITHALMNRAERGTNLKGSEFGLFETTILLEEQVRQRTQDLEAALAENLHMNRVLRELHEQLRAQALHDPLTGLFNRRYLEETLDRELARAARQGEPLSLIMGDIDHFKSVNDCYGHLAGDAVLRAFSRLLKSHARDSDVHCRYGGEEFLLVLPGMPAGAALERAEHLRQTIAAAAIGFGELAIMVTASFGIAAYPWHGATGNALIAAADQALYAAKAQGRNRSRLGAAPQDEPDALPHFP